MAFTKIDDLIDSKKIRTIGIAGHIRPDADCICSSLALWQYLTKCWPQVRTDVFLEEIPSIYSFIKGSDQVHTDYVTDVAEYDLFIAVDTDKSRTGRAEALFDAARFTVNIDHHVSNHGTGDENYLDADASSCSELIYELIEHEHIDRGIAETLYCGIIGDTGVFKYNCTSPKTMRIGADLISYGFDFNDLIDRTFYRKTYVQNQLLGRVLMESTLFLGGKCILGMVSRKTMEFYHATTSDLEGIVSQLMLTSGVVCAIFLHETGSLEYKASLRSNGMVDVSKIAEIFGGGGHVRAAGCTMNGTSHDCINNLSKYIAEQIHGIG
ncbi:MAG: bifunctional oligoribonuclease/PAP phosphatase NrnA [Lachnospiraceae bacterium]|nr:bifunctional oligoribonuclease/PAP phosphatase NrnA [Lachnospiraceae bacterium]